MILARLQSANQLRSFKSKCDISSKNGLVLLKGEDWINSYIHSEIPNNLNKIVVRNSTQELFHIIKFWISNRGATLFYAQFNSTKANLIGALFSKVVFLEDGTNALLFNSNSIWRLVVSGWSDFRPEISDKLNEIKKVKLIHQIDFNTISLLKIVGSPCIEKKQIYDFDFKNIIEILVLLSKIYGFKLEYYPHRHETRKNFLSNEIIIKENLNIIDELEKIDRENTIVVCGMTTVLFEVDKSILDNFYIFSFFRFKKNKLGKLYKNIQRLLV